MLASPECAGDLKFRRLPAFRPDSAHRETTAIRRSGTEKPQEHSFLHNPKTAGRLLFLMVFLLSALYAAKDLKRGWIPSDEGTFGQSAERVLQGELPHKDFDEGYTGGLTYLHALAFRVRGTNLASLRYVLYLFFLAWVPAIYLAALRFVSSPVASAVTFLAVAWSIPNYSAPMPSWYNLFFATFGLVSILRYIETGNRRWLFIAGLCGGLSFLFKQTGLYFIAGVLLFLVFREQVAPGNRSSRNTETVLYRIFLVSSLFLYEALLVNLLRRTHSTKTFLYFSASGTGDWCSNRLERILPGRGTKSAVCFPFSRVGAVRGRRCPPGPGLTGAVFPDRNRVSVCT